MKIDGFAIYIDSDEKSMLLTSPSFLDENLKPIEFDTPTRETLSIAMIRLNECLYTESINWAYVFQPFLPHNNKIVQATNWNPNDFSNNNKPCNYIIRP